MKRYLFLPFIISILGHGIFFGTFKSTFPAASVFSSPSLYIIPSGQIKHEMTRDIALTPLASMLSGKNPIWADTLQLSKGIKGAYHEIPEGSMLLPLEKVHTLQKLPLSGECIELSQEEILPRFSDLFYEKIPSEIVRGQLEQVINLDNNLQLIYYIQGPTSGRGLQVFNLPLEVEKAPVELKLRFWVAKNGRVNQVIIEEGSGFPKIDEKMVNALKQWRFNPIYMPSATKYQWGVIKIRVQG